MNYRILKEGETILPTDQYLDNGKWIAPNCIGEKAPNPQFTSHRIYRRKNPAAVALGRLGGKAGRGHVKARTSEQARQAVMVRWAKRNQAAQLAKQGYTPLPEDCDREQ